MGYDDDYLFHEQHWYHRIVSAALQHPLPLALFALSCMGIHATNSQPQTPRALHSQDREACFAVRLDGPRVRPGLFGYDTQRSRPPSGLLLELIRLPQLGSGKCSSIPQFCRGRPLVSALPLYPGFLGSQSPLPASQTLRGHAFCFGVVLWPTFLVVGHNN